MREEFMIARSGKQYVLFAGLLDESHRRFDKWWEMDTELVQVPAKENGMVAVVHAHFIGEPKESTQEIPMVTKASGIGDASPENVGRNIAPHIIRMAETRAKARALRDAVNVGATSLEELSEQDEAPAQATARAPAKPEEVPEKAPEIGGKRGQLLDEFRAGLRLVYGEEWQKIERGLVKKSKAQKAFHTLTASELEAWVEWVNGKVSEEMERRKKEQETDMKPEPELEEPPF